MSTLSGYVVSVFRVVLGLAMLVACSSFVGRLAAAADTLKPKMPLSSVKLCVSEGEGFFYIPQSDVCLRVGSYLWAEGYYNSYTHYPPRNDKTYSISTGGLILDARTATDFGTLRSYMEYRYHWRSADPWSDGPNEAQLQIWLSYLQLGGFTAGYAQSFFDFYANEYVQGTDPATIGDDLQLNLVAYTSELGDGLSATLSMEDSSERNGGIYSVDPAAGALGADYEGYQAGAQFPDIVGNLNLTREWGQAQLTGALHQIRAFNFYNAPDISEANWGYALQAGLMLNLPMLGEGDAIYFQSAYMQGAVSYLGLVDPTNGQYMPPDAFLGPDGLSKVGGWNFTASLLHNWNARWGTALFGGYAHYKYNNPTLRMAYGASGGVNFNFGAYISYAPHQNLKMYLQYDYTHIQATDYLKTTYSADYEAVDASRLLLFITRNF
ncbi:porin [Xanthobacter sp. TB0139]|uniref:porin n=1 Tax=Xanthobacter sp. TB0139 TaxID=3459178 RepID=UPI004039640C